MRETERTCFVLMPFAAELHYFYLYMKQHIEQKYGIRCERADAQILTKPILDKINDYIRNSDVIVADCSGRNPNVFYELGIALRDAVAKRFCILSREEFVRVATDRFRQMRAQNADVVHHRVAGGAGLLGSFNRYPQCRQTKRRVLCGLPFNGLVVAASRDRKFLSTRQFEARELHALQQNGILARPQ